VTTTSTYGVQLFCLSWFFFWPTLMQSRNIKMSLQRYEIERAQN